MATDGSVLISVDLDDKAAQARLKELDREIAKTKATIGKKESAKSAIEEQMEQAAAKADEARKSVQYLREEIEAAQEAMKPGSAPEDYLAARDAVEQLQPHLVEAEKEAAALEKEADKTRQKYEKASSDIENLQQHLADTEREAAGINANLAQTPANANLLAEAAQRVDDGFKRFEKRMKGLVKRILFFSVFTMALRGVRTWLSNVVKSNDEAAAAMARLKGALLTMVQPLVDVIIPAFTAFVNVLTRVVSMVARFVSLLFGKSLSDSAAAAKELNQNIGAAGKSAQKAQKSFAAFDEINQLNSGEQGGGGGASSGIQPDFSFDTQKLTPELEGIARLVAAIGVGLAAWKIAGFINDVLKLGLTMKQLGGIALIAGGAFLAITNYIDAWKNGINDANLSGIFLGITAAVLGLYLALGATAAAIGAIIAGIALFVLAIRDANANGVNLYNTLALIAGLLLAGLGISKIVGGPIPALIAAIMAVVAAVVFLTGNGQEMFDTFKFILGEIGALAKALVNGDMEEAGKHAKRLLAGVGNLGIIVAESFANAFIKAINWVLRKFADMVNNVFDRIPDKIKEKLGIEDWSLTAHQFDEIHIPRIEIPALARGAVVPPNREFMAMLGDNTQETEVVSPLSTMRQAMVEALQAVGYGGDQTTILMIDGQEFARAVYKANRRESQRIGVSLGGVK